ncbi:rubredoxin [Phaeospirillum tilakii]|uniref:Rubredoxin n=1 Tax=Phaeospirillum tilakii TaxID=741673 RepID=A0ABW5C9V2_9PROT
MSETTPSRTGAVARESDGRLALWVCNRCGHVYDPAQGEPLQAIGPGVPFEYLPDDWLCPHCGAPKDLYLH